MPLYTFRCRKCRQLTAATLGVNEPKIKTCQCGGELYRVFDRPNIIYRGSGFYHTDKVLSDPDPDDLD